MGRINQETFDGCIHYIDRVIYERVDTSNLGFIGLIEPGRFPSRDIDLLILPAKNAQVGESIIQMNNMINYIDEFFKEKGQTLAPFPTVLMEAESNYCVEMGVGDKYKIVPLHTLYFPDKDSFNKKNPKSFLESIIHKTIPLKGELLSCLKNLEKVPQESLDQYFFAANFQLSLKSEKYPETITQEKMSKLKDYFSKNYNINIKNPGPRTIDEELLTVLDEITIRA